MALIPVIIKGMQEQQKQLQDKDATITTQQKQLDQQQAQINAILQKLNEMQTAQEACCSTITAQSSAESSNSVILTDGVALDQNIPNPFTNTTSIGYTLREKFANAQIIITDRNGKILKTVNISDGVHGKLTVDASVLAAGAYNYSLFVDGKLIDAKQMILTK